jgi:hypothetical protein
VGSPGFVNYKKGCTRLAATSDKVYQLLAHGRWFSLGTPVSSTTKTGCHDIAEILLKVALNIKNQINQSMCFVIVANWDGFIDRESGMLGYTIFVGLTECEDLVHQHHDPEKHLFDKSQWTHSAMISPIPAPYTVLPGKQLLSIQY